MFKHFIITRFNLRLNDLPAWEKYNLPEHTDEWLERRFLLFEEYCLPSLFNQSCKNYIWLVLFDKYTPERFIQKINNYESLFPLLKPLFLDKGDNESIIRMVNSELNKYVGTNVQYIITSRIDNDDALHRDYVYEVQKHFNNHEEEFLSFTYGLQYDVQRRVMVRMHFGNNHFISRIEKLSSNIETVLKPAHMEISRIGEVSYIANKQKPLWLEVIHGGNIINKLYPGSVPLFRCQTKMAYNFNTEISHINSVILYLQFLRLQISLMIAKFLNKNNPDSH